MNMPCSKEGGIFVAINVQICYYQKAVLTIVQSVRLAAKMRGLIGMMPYVLAIILVVAVGACVHRIAVLISKGRQCDGMDESADRR